MRSLLSALPLATLCYYHDFYCHLRSLRSHLGSRPVGRGPPASLLGLIGRWHREDRSCPDARRKEGAREEEGRATAAAPEEGGRATAAAPPSSKVQGHPSNSIGDNRVGDTSDTTTSFDSRPQQESCQHPRFKMEAGKAGSRAGRPARNYSGDDQPIVDFFHKHLLEIKNRRDKKRSSPYHIFRQNNISRRVGSRNRHIRSGQRHGFAQQQLAIRRAAVDPLLPSMESPE